MEISWYRGFIQGKTRIFTGWLFAVLLGVAARETPQWHGILLCFVGATLRFWASGYLRKDTRPAVGGPYAFIRNPLYLGTYLMALGAVLAIESWLFLAALTVIFAALYHYIILDEESKLQRIFGAPYLEYCQNVPRFFPRLFPPLTPAESKVLLQINPEQTHHRFDWELAMKNKAYEAYASFIALIGFLWGISLLWKFF